MSRIRIRGSCAIKSSVLPWFVRKENSGAELEALVFSPTVTDIDIAIYITRYEVRMYSGCVETRSRTQKRPEVSSATREEEAMEYLKGLIERLGKALRIKSPSQAPMASTPTNHILPPLSGVKSWVPTTAAG